jgi:UDP-N-acetylmuramate--alanine ligase
MTAKILIEAGMDPMVILGSKYKLFGGKNFRAGSGHFILEADEFGASFHHYSPLIAVINNIDREHLDFYKNLANVKKSFLKFISNIRSGGTLILNKDDKTLLTLKTAILKIAGKHSLKIVWYSLKDAEAGKIKKVLPVPGIHNLSNALAAFKVAKALRIPEAKILTALKAYEGIWRRMEYKGKLKNGTLIFDDYGHHPSEIKATLAAFKEKYPKKKLICVFQPHQAKRLRTLFKDFLAAFENADSLILFPTYTVAGRDINEKVYTAKHLVSEIKKQNFGKEIYYLKTPVGLKKLVFKLSDSGANGSVVVLMGAGTISDYTDSLLS